MSNSSFHLYQLQKIDLRIDQINLRIKKTNDLIKDNKTLSAAEEKVNQVKAILHQKTTELNNIEDISKNKQIKIEQTEASLYKGSISNPKELKDLQIEVASLKKSLSLIEENQLLLMAEVESLEANFISEKDQYAIVLSESEILNHQFFQELETHKKENEKLAAERYVAAGQLQPEHISAYEKLRVSKNRIAVTSVEDESCATCGSEISASDIQKARGSVTLSFCPSCGRILYAG